MPETELNLIIMGMEILIYPHEILRTEADPVENIDGELQRFIDAMIDHMYRAKGIGLAANQVGELKQLLVMDCNQAEGMPRSPVVVINPIITASEATENSEEGCLSVPDYTATIKRAARVEVKGYDRNGREITIEADGIVARCLQHEIDHLNGICFVDRLGPVKKALFKKKWAKMRAAAMQKQSESQ